MKKRVLSVLLVMCMVLSMLPATATATEISTAFAGEDETTTLLVSEGIDHVEVESVLYVIDDYKANTTDAYGNPVVNNYAIGVDMQGREVHVLVGIDYESDEEDLGTNESTAKGFYVLCNPSDTTAAQKGILECAALDVAYDENRDNIYGQVTAFSGSFELKAETQNIPTVGGTAVLDANTRYIVVGGTVDALETAVVTGSIRHTFEDGMQAAVLLKQDESGNAVAEAVIIFTVAEFAPESAPDPIPDPEPERPVTASGYCGGEGDGTNLTWTLYEDGELVISGSGKMTDYESRLDQPWWNYHESIKSVEIGEKVTSIGDRALSTCSATEIVIPFGVTSVGECAFWGCESLERVAIPASTTEIGDSAFSSCSNLENIYINENNSEFITVDGVLFDKGCTKLLRYPPKNDGEVYDIHNGVTHIANDAFESCVGLTSVTIPSSVISIGDSAFYGCTNLTQVDFLGDAPSSANESAFYYGLSNLIIYYHEGTAGWLDSEYYDAETGTWCGCSLVMIPAEVYEITVGTATNGVVIVDKTTAKAGEKVSVTAVPEDGYELEYILVDGVAIDGNTFIATGNHTVTATFAAVGPKREVIASGYCGGEVDGTNLTWTLYEDGEMVIEGAGVMGEWKEREDAPWYSVYQKIKLITVQEGVTNISDYGFYFCCYATSVSIPASVTSIGDYALIECWELTSIVVDEDNETYKSVDGVLFSKDMKTLIRFPEALAGSYSVPNGVTSIGVRAFHRVSLTAVTLPDGLLEIKNSAFDHCVFKSITIPNSVTNIGNNAFWQCNELTTVTLPDSLLAIGNCAFEYCTSLETIDIPVGVTEIGNSAFSNCRNLVTLNIPDSVTDFGAAMLEKCEKLTEVNIPYGITNFGSYMFEGCKSLKKLCIPASVTTIWNHVFYNCTSLEELEFKGDFPILGNNGDQNSFVTNGNLTIYYHEGTEGWTSNKYYDDTAKTLFGHPLVMIPAGPVNYCGGEGDGTNLTWVLTEDGELIISGTGKMADYSNYTKTPWYEKRSSIKTITIEDGVTTIGDNAFHICWSLTKLNIANSVTTIGECAFHNCYALKSIEIPEGVTTIEEGAFEMCFGLTTVSLPDSLTTIEDIAFMSCDKLESVHIPAGVTSIGRAFDGCTGLMEITVDDANTAYSSRDGVLFNKAQTVLVCCPGKKNGHYTIPDSVTTIREYAFSNCTKLTGVTIPDGVTTIEEYSFWCCGLTEVIVPDSVTAIGNRAFYTSSLTRMEFLGNAPTTIGSNAFDCGNLTIYYHEGTTGWTDSEHYDAEAGTWCGRPLVKILASGYCGGEGDGTNLTWTLYEDGELVIDGIGAMYNWDWFASGADDVFVPWFAMGVNAVTINEGVTTIGDGAFSRTNVTSMVIPNSVTTIGEAAFYECINLTSVSIPNGVTTIGDCAFFCCVSLSEVVLPDSVTTIGTDAFNCCDSLIAVTIPASVTAIGEYAFSDCTDLRILCFMGDAPTFYERREDDTSRFGIYCFTEKNGWTDSEHYDAETGMWYGNPLVELFNRRGLAVWLAETYLDPDMQIDLSKSYFTDVDINDKNFREIMLCSYLGLFAGSDGKFNPDGTVNRAQMATVLAKVYNGSDFNADSFKGQSHFSDTADFEGGWAEGYINWAFQQGLMKAYDEMAADFFMPNITTRKIDIMTVGMKHVVMVGQAENGIVSIDKTYGAEGETVTVTAVPDTGYQLRKILVSGKAIDGNTFTITGNHFVTALFGIIASITTDSVDDATQHVPYSAMIQTDHWDDSMSFELASGRLPTGLELKKSGELYGVPSQAGTFTFTVNAVYSDDGTVVDSKEFSLTVLEDIPENIEDVNKGPEGYEVKEHIGTPVTNQQGDTHYEIDVQKVKEEDLVFVSEGEFDEFVDVYLDGRKLVRDEEYTVEEGSTKITIRAQTFKSAGNGQHVIAAEFRSGETLKKTAQSVTVSGVKTASLGGGSVSTVKQYKITVEPNANGTITCTRTSAREKEIVVVTVQPAAGYIVKSVSAGSGVKVSVHSGNEYKFTMPASDVTVSVVFEAELPFGDVAAEGAFYKAVKFVYENGIMVGTGENTFEPDAKLSRAMVVQVLYNYEKQPEVAVGTDFADVPEGQWYTSAVRWATEKGVVAGYGDGTFGTNDDVTIEQVAVILWNYAGQPMAEGETVPAESSQWAINALDWCAKQGILEGIDATDTTVAATRAQTAQILKNFLQKV